MPLMSTEAAVMRTEPLKSKTAIWRDSASCKKKDVKPHLSGAHGGRASAQAQTNLVESLLLLLRDGVLLENWAFHLTLEIPGVTQHIAAGRKAVRF